MSSNHPSYPYQQRPQHQGQNTTQSFQPSGLQDFTPSQQQTYEPPPQHRQQHTQIPGLNIVFSNNKGGSNPRDTPMSSRAVPTSGPQPPTRTATASPIPSSHHRQDSAAFGGDYIYATGTHAQNYQQPVISIAEMGTMVVSSSDTRRGRVAIASHESGPASGFAGYTQYPGPFAPATSGTGLAPQYRTNSLQRADEYFDYIPHTPTTSSSSYGGLYQTADTVRPTPSAPTYSPVYQKYQQAGIAAQQQVSRAVTPVQTQYPPSRTVTPMQAQHPPSRTITPVQAQHQAPNTVMQTYQVEQYPAGATTQQMTTQHPQPRTFPPTPTANTPSGTGHTPASSYQTAPNQAQFAAPKSTNPKPKPKHHDKESITFKNWTGPAAAPPPPKMVGGSQIGATTAVAAGGFGRGRQQKAVTTQNMTSLGTVGVIGAEQERSWARNGAGSIQAQEQLSQAPQQVQQSQARIQASRQASQLQHTYQPQLPQAAVHIARPWPVPHQYNQYSQPPPAPQPAPQHQPQREPNPQYPPQAQAALPQEPIPPPCAPSEPHPPPLLNKDLIEQQMKIMVERMRYYQAADPATFQTVWDSMRKNGQAGNAGGEDRRAIMPAAAGMVRSESTASEQTVVYTPSWAPEKAAEVKEVDTTPRHAQHTQGPSPVSTQPAALSPVQTQTQPQYQPPPPPPPPPPVPTLNPPQDALHLRTAQAVSKYLIKTSGHCLPEEVIVDLLRRIKSFPVLCDKLESMGYKFHRGGFSRFLLAEVDGEKDEAAGQKDEMEVTENKDVMMLDEKYNRRSGVLGEIGDDQMQLMKEANEMREAEVRRVINGPPPSPPARSPKMGKEKPTTPTSEGGLLEASQLHKTTLAAPETPTVSNKQRTALPTPVSAAPTAPMPCLDGRLPVAQMAAPAFNPSTQLLSQLQSQGSIYHPPSDDQVSPSPGPDFPRHPTPQSVKATYAAPPRDSEMKRFVSPSLVYQPPTPPLVIDVDSPPSPTPPEMDSPVTADEIVSSLDGRRMEEQSEQEFPSSRKLTKSVKLRLENQKLLAQHTPVTISSSSSSSSFSPTPAGDSVQQPVARRVGKTVIDLTVSATPEPQMNHAPQLPASAPNPRNLIEKEQQWLNPRNSKPAFSPTAQQPIPIPQTAPVTRRVPTIGGSPILFKHINRKKLLKKPVYDPATIARDIQIATGRRPQWVRPLNAHLDALRTQGLIPLDADLETVRWDLLDPDPVGFTVRYDAAIDDDEDGGYGEFEGVDVAVARAPVMLNNRAPMKGMVNQAAVPSPTPAARGRTRIRKSDTPSASVMSFQNLGMGFTTTSNGMESTDNRAGTQATSNNSGNGSGDSNGSARINNGGASRGGFSAPTGSRTSSGLRHVMTPDAGGNFAVVIRSPSISSTDRSRPPNSTNAKGLKRKLDGNDKDKGTPVTKKAAKPARPSAKKDKETVGEMRPSGFKVFKCRWKLCPAELHNFETLHRHVVKAHCKLASYGGYPCHWECCSRSPTKEMKKAAAASRGPGNAVASRITWDFDTPAQWEAHILTSHLEGVRNEIGVGPSVGPYDHEAVASDIDYLSDSFGHQVTPVARPAPRGHVFLPPPGYEFSSPHSSMSRHLQRARLLGVGMEGDEAADLMANDDGQGIHLIVRRIVPAEDVPSLGAGGSNTSPSQGVKAKAKGKGKAVEKEKSLESLGRGSDEAGPSNAGVGAFTVYDHEEYCL